MKVRTRLIVPAVVIPVLAVTLHACGGDDDPQTVIQTDPLIVTDPDRAVSFFNDEAETAYVDSMIVRFASFFRPLASLGEGSSGSGSSSSPVEDKRTVAATETDSQNCTGGGNLQTSYTTDDDTDEFESASFEFNNCVEDGETSNGSIALTADLDENTENGTASIVADNFSVTGGDEDMSLDGSVNLQMQGDDNLSSFSISGPGISIMAGGESITLSNYSLTVIDDVAGDNSSLSASMTLESSEDGTITFAIDPPLSGGGEDDYPTAGTIAMTHSDGSSLTLDVGNGDPETFNYTISDNGTVTSGVQRWDETNLDELDL